MVDHTILPSSHATEFKIAEPNESSKIVSITPETDLLMALFGGLISLVFLFVPPLNILISRFFEYLKNPQQDPDFLINTPFLAFGFILLIFGTTRIIQVIQGAFGVRRYVFDGRFIEIQHFIGRTRIPIDKVEDVTVDRLLRMEVKNPKLKGGVTTTIFDSDSKGNRVKTYDSWLPYCFPPYASVSGGSCLLVKLKGDDVKIALTPYDTDAMVQILKKSINESPSQF